MKKDHAKNLLNGHQLPEGFDQRFFQKLDKEKKSFIRPPMSLLDALTGSLIPLSFALSLCFVIFSATQFTPTLDSQLEAVVFDLDGDISDLNEDQWDLLMQVAEN